MTTVSYAEERWADVWQEMQPLWLLHWREVALDHETITLKPQLDAYAALEAAGILHALVARAAGEVIGYHLAFVRVHMHYAADPHAFTDIYYVHPDHRRGFVGVNLFREYERHMRRRGVKKLVSATKLHISNVTGGSLDISPIFKRLGWRNTESGWTKYIGS